MKIRRTETLLILGMLFITNMPRDAAARQDDAAARQDAVAARQDDVAARQDDVAALVAKYRADAIRMREHIHQNPELSNREFKTAALVADHLTALGIEIRTDVAHTGVVGVLEGGRPGPVVAVRADMDALPSLEVGTVGYTIGPAFAAVDHFTIKVRGKQAHGARPEEGIDPVVMASEIVLALQTIRSRTLSPLEPSVVTVGIVRGGERFNIIPREVHLEGTVRTYNPEVRDTVERRMASILEGITAAYDGTFALDYDRGTPSVINDPALSREMAGYLAGAPGVEQVLELPPTMGGEDFAYFANVVPGFFYRLGTTRPGQPSGGLHTPTMTADSESVTVGMRVMTHLVLEFLNARAPRSNP